jgi:hypothetical protein
MWYKKCKKVRMFFIWYFWKKWKEIDGKRKWVAKLALGFHPLRISFAASNLLVSLFVTVQIQLSLIFFNKIKRCIVKQKE